jgi:serine/threonine protein kinase
VLQDHGCLSIRRFVSIGSIYDVINDVKPKLNYLKKSNRTSKRRSFDLNVIRSVGFQILTGLKFLHDKNLAHGKTRLLACSSK